MAHWDRSERGIGRGEIAESRLEAPLLAGAMLFCAVILFVFHLYVQVPAYTVAMGVSMGVFAATLIRVEIGIGILAVAMLLSPEITTGPVGSGGVRFVNVRYDDVLIIVIFLGVLVKLAYEGRPTLFRPNPIIPGMFAYYLVCIISTLLALRVNVPAWDPDMAFFVMLKMLEFYMVFVMVGLAITNLREVRRQLVVFLIVAFIVCVYGIVTIGTEERVGAPFEAGGTEPNTLGGYLIIVMCTALGLLVYAPRRLKWLFAGLLAAAFVPFVMTLSRASYIAALAAFLALGILGRRWSVITLVAVILISSPYIMPSDVIDRVNYTFQQGSGQKITIAGRETGLQVDTSTYERIYVWQKVAFNLRVWPWFGGGVTWGRVLDSQFALVLIETGVFGALTFGFLLYRTVKTTREAYRWSRDWVAKGLALGAFAFTVGMLVHALGTITFLIVRIMEPFWFLIALTVVAREVAIREHARRLHEQRARPTEQPAASPVTKPGTLVHHPAN